jgi:hypothetical protein
MLTPEFVFTQNLIFLCELKPHAKFWNPTISPSGRKVTAAEREREEEKKTALIVDSAHKPLGPINHPDVLQLHHEP